MTTMNVTYSAFYQGMHGTIFDRLSTRIHKTSTVVSASNRNEISLSVSHRENFQRTYQ